MNIIVAYKKDGVVYMGSDTRIDGYDQKFNELCECNYSIQKLDNGILVGFIGEKIEVQTLKAYLDDIFTLDGKGELTRKHLVTKIVPSLIEMLKSEKLYNKSDTDNPFMKMNIMVAHKDKLYEICSGFEIYTYEDFQVIGKTLKFAEPVMFNTKPDDDIYARIVKALDITAQNTAIVARPYVLIDTKDLQYKILGDNNL